MVWKFWIFVFLCLQCRIGEAAVPGPADTSPEQPDWLLPDQPTWVLGTGNPGGINNKLDALNHFGSGWFHLAETHASRFQQSKFQSHMKQVAARQQRQIRTCVGALAPLRSGSVTAGAWTGVLNFADCPLRQVPVQWPHGEYESGRVMLTAARHDNLELIAATV